jgi:hypothetical protein
MQQIRLAAIYSVKFYVKILNILILNSTYVCLFLNIKFIKVKKDF